MKRTTNGLLRGEVAATAIIVAIYHLTREPPSEENLSHPLDFKVLDAKRRA